MTTKGWQVTYGFPGNDEEVTQWVDADESEALSEFLVRDAAKTPERWTEVRWVGFE